jgi:hypothetical protein
MNPLVDVVLGSRTGLTVAAALFVAGGITGVAAALRFSAFARRIRRLEDEIRALRQQDEIYRQSVADHFDRTSEIFRDLTGQYRALYTHLSEGARALCRDAVPALRFDQGVMLPTAAEGPRAHDEDQARSGHATGNLPDAEAPPNRLVDN